MTERCSSRGAASLSSCRCLLGLRLTVVSLWNKTKQRAFIHRITLPEIMSKGKLSLGNWLHTKMVHKRCIYCLNNKVNIQVNAMQVKKQNQRWTLSWHWDVFTFHYFTTWVCIIKYVLFYIFLPSLALCLISDSSHADTRQGFRCVWSVELVFSGEGQWGSWDRAVTSAKKRWSLSCSLLPEQKHHRAGPTGHKQSFARVHWGWPSGQVQFSRSFPGGSVVEDSPANAGDVGSAPNLGRSHMPQGN